MASRLADNTSLPSLIPPTPPDPQPSPSATTVGKRRSISLSSFRRDGDSHAPATTTTTKPSRNSRETLRQQTNAPTSSSSTPSGPANAPDRRVRAVSSPRVVAEQQPSLRLAPSDSAHTLPLPQSPTLEPRSPFNRRPPASRSSHGIETSSGPPPALSTQRTQSEAAWKLRPPREKPDPYPPLTTRSLARLDAVNNSQRSGVEPETLELEPNSQEDPHSRRSHTSTGASQKPGEPAEMATMALHHKRYSVEVDPKRTAFRSGDLPDPQRFQPSQLGRSKSARTKEERQSQSSQEDLFLNLARADSAAGGSSDSDYRRSRIAMAGHHRQSSSQGTIPSSLPQTDRNSRPLEDLRTSSFITTRRSSLRKPGDTDYYGSSSSTERPEKPEREYAATTHPLDIRSNARLTTGTAKSTIATPRGILRRDTSPESPLSSRRTSVPDSQAPLPARPYRQSNLSSYTTNSRYEHSPLPTRSSAGYDKQPSPTTPRAEGTESTVSTTAPSTVWDELDELKSRIRRLEGTGKLPTSSNAAMSNAIGERPPTATTTVTTMSSSPKRARGLSISPGNSVVGAPEEATLHPLLHAALARSKSLVSAEVFKALEAAAGDALTLAKVTSGSLPQGGVPSAIDRQLKRKADSMCRSLTELCIAVSDDRTDTELEKPKSRPSSSHANVVRQLKPPSVDETRFQRAASQEPEASSSARVLSRLEARRSSMLNSSPSAAAAREPYTDAARTPTQTKTPTAPRTSTVLQRARRATVDEDTVRPLSRAMTELGHHRLSTRTAREYTSLHPLPISGPVPTTPTQSNLPARRSYLSRADTKPLPATPPAPALSRRSLADRVAPNSADGAAQLSEARQQRLAGLGIAGRQLGSITRRLRPPVQGAGGREADSVD